jgi:hypothetical protein
MTLTNVYIYQCMDPYAHTTGPRLTATRYTSTGLLARNSGTDTAMIEMFLSSRVYHGVSITGL